MSIRFEFDESIGADTRRALASRKKATVDPRNILVGDLVRLFTEDDGEEYTFRCAARRHDITPDPLGQDAEEGRSGASRTFYVLTHV